MNMKTRKEIQDEIVSMTTFSQKADYIMDARNDKYPEKDLLEEVMRDDMGYDPDKLVANFSAFKKIEHDHNIALHNVLKNCSTV